jgi:hypothetical protein
MVKRTVVIVGDGSQLPAFFLENIYGPGDPIRVLQKKKIIEKNGTSIDACMHQAPNQCKGAEPLE